MAIIDNPTPTFWRSKKRNPVLQLQWFDKGGRSRKGVTNRRHPRQQQQRVNFQRVRFLWLSLTTAERDTWVNFASTYTTVNKYGDTIIIGAWQWFAKFNLRLISTGQSLLTNAPPDPTPAYTPAYNLSPPGGGSEWSVTIIPFPINSESVLVRRKINLPWSSSSPPKPLNFLKSVDSSDSSPVTLATVDEIDFDFKKFWVGFQALDDYGRTNGFEYFLSTSNP